MSLTPAEVSAREAAALKSIQTRPVVEKATPGNGEDATPPTPTTEVPTPSESAMEAPTPPAADADDPLGAESLRKRVLAICLEQTFNASDYHPEARELVAELIGPRLEMDKDGKPVLRSGEDLLELTAEHLQEALGPVGGYLRKAKGFSGSGSKAPRVPLGTTKREAWVDSQEAFEKDRKQIRAARKRGAGVTNVE